MNKIKAFFKEWRLGVTFFFIYTLICLVYTTIKILIQLASSILNYIF